jgi:filamentous hemagglutinin
MGPRLGREGRRFGAAPTRGAAHPPFNARTIDDFSDNGVAVSIKSIDLNAPWYSNPLNLSYQINRYVDQLGAFDGIRSGGVEIASEDINGKVLDIVVPRNSGTPVQQQAITASIARAGKLGIHIFISRY